MFPFTDNKIDFEKLSNIFDKIENNYRKSRDFLYYENINSDFFDYKNLKNDKELGYISEFIESLGVSEEKGRFLYKTVMLLRHTGAISAVETIKHQTVDNLIDGKLKPSYIDMMCMN